MPRDTIETTARAPHHAKAIRVKAEDVKDDGTFSGYGSVFDVQDSGYDIVMPGAFTKSLAEHRRRGRMPKLLWQHNPNEPIGLWLDMREDAHGLYCEGRLLTEVARARDAHVLLKAGAIEGLSIGYDCKNYEIDHEGEASCPYGMIGYGSPGIRRLVEIDLWEVSIVTFPMCAEAEVDRVKRGVSDTVAPLRDLAGLARIVKRVNRAI